MGGITAANQNATVSTTLSLDQVRIVLEWGAAPRDLDSHLTGSTSSGSTFHIYFGNKSYSESGIRKILMKIKLFAVITVLFMISGCGKNDQRVDIDTILANQKILFIMSVSSYDEPYSTGYFIDGKGKKHIYGPYLQHPFESIEKEYAFFLEHYDEFETIDFFDDKTLRKCIKYLYHVNSDSDIITEGEAIMDAPLKQLYGIRLNDDQEEFVWLGSEPGISKRLDDPSSDLIFKKFGEKWYLIK